MAFCSSCSSNALDQLDRIGSGVPVGRYGTGVPNVNESGEDMTEEAKPLRADARRNRARVLEAAEAVLARDGSAASIRAVAQQAGVGLGTIYRHFPTREALYEAILVDRLQRLAERSAALRKAEDAGGCPPGKDDSAAKRKIDRKDGTVS